MRCRGRKGCKSILKPTSRTGICDRCRHASMCRVCSVKCGSKLCAECEQVTARIEDSHYGKHTPPHHELDERIEKYAARYEAGLPLFLGNER